MERTSQGSPGGTPGAKVHINPNFKAPTNSSSAVHINPKFGQAHVNPNFQQKSPAKSSSSSVHINPKFANRPLPSIPDGEAKSSAPHVNPKLLSSTAAKPLIDAERKDGYHQAVAKSVANVFINPKFGKTKSTKTVYVDPSLVRMQKQPGNQNKMPSPGSEKENKPTASAASARDRRSVFKKIGNKKLIRVGKESTATPSRKRDRAGQFKKIGTKKLVRKATPPTAGTKRRSSSATPKSGGNTSWKSKSYKTPQQKKRSAILRLMTPLSMRKVRISPPFRASKSLRDSPARGKRSLYRGFNPFKVDRRRPGKSAKTPSGSNNAISTPRQPPAAAAKTPKSLPPPKPLRTSLLQTPSTPARKEAAVINIQGIKYKISANGKTLNRVEEQKHAAAAPSTAAVGMTKSNPVRASLMSRKVFIEGEEFVEEEDRPGVLVRARNSMTRASITNARNRSINTILKSQARSRQYCMFFNKFGRCNKRDKGVCPYIHDSDKVAVCRRFLQGSCVKEDCLLSHKVAPEKMPSCKFFLEGLCSRGEDCPYRHVKVSANADICPEYLKGYCSAGQECKLRHVSRCPQFEKTGVCARGQRCPYPHTTQSKADAAAAKRAAASKRAPPKPKRKSGGGGGASAATGENKKAKMRYFEEEAKAVVDEKHDLNSEEPLSGAMEAKRKRLLRKVELAKQGWVEGGGGGGDQDKLEPDSDDSGPYEEIEERAPLGDLPAYIPLEGGSDAEEEDEFEERLI